MNRLKRHVVEALTEVSIKLIAYHLLQAIFEVVQEITLVIEWFACACKSSHIMILDSSSIFASLPNSTKCLIKWDLSHIFGNLPLYLV